jgi:GMP reductase
MGMGDANSNMNEIQKAQDILDTHRHIQFICIDVANGYTEKFVRYVEFVRKTFPRHILIAGNVVTREMTEALILAGANIVKIGIGPGSVCTTRKVAGVGYPQLSCIMECADAAHGLGGYVLSDGGCTCPGDVAKAFGAGADFVMIGGMFAGTDEAAGESTEDGKVFYGMSSAEAMNKHSGGVAIYRAAEGKRVVVPHVGSVDGVMQQILGGVRSACTYVGASRLKDLSKCTTFIRVNRQLNTVWGNEA